MQTAQTTEVETLREHLERFRTTTLQILEVIDDRELAWRPTPESFSTGQQLLHVAQTEDYFSRGLFERDWSPERLRLVGPAGELLGSRAVLRGYFDAVRENTRRHLDGIADRALDEVREDVPGAPMPLSLRWWLWFLVEHEMHHKGQLAVYLRQMGHVAPYYALPLPPGERPDLQAQAALGGV